MSDNPRLAPFNPQDLDAEQAALYREITGGPRASGPRLFELTDEQGRLLGPFNAMLLSPALGHALQGLGAAIRYGGGLSPRVREIAILAVSAHWDCAFEREAHEAVGRHVGLSEAEIRSLREGAPPDLHDPLERAALDVVRALLTRGDITDDAYDEARQRIGERALFELSTLVGYYSMLAMQLRLFRT